MVSFEEQFPSLWGEVVYNVGEGIPGLRLDTIQEHCLDKQTVKEAINIELSKARLLIKEHERNSALIEYFKGQIDMCIILLKRLED